jgi:hypothetical protein
MMIIPSETAQTLRQRDEVTYRMAEERALQTPFAAETKKLLHERQVHQIDLEMQNEELQRKAVDLIQHFPVGFLHDVSCASTVLFCLTYLTFLFVVSVILRPLVM